MYFKRRPRVNAATISGDGPRLVERFVVRYGLVFSVMCYVATGGMATIPSLIDRRNVFYKHRDANFFPTASYVLADCLIDWPLTAAEILLYSNLCYWAAGLEPSGFFMFFLVLFALTARRRRLEARRSRGVAGGDAPPPGRRSIRERRSQFATPPRDRRDAASTPPRCRDAAMPPRRRDDTAGMPRRRRDAAAVPQACMTRIFNFVAACAPTNQEAAPCAGTLTILLIMFSGFAITLGDLPVYWKWCYWASPVTWAYLGLRGTLLEEGRCLFAASGLEAVLPTQVPRHHDQRVHVGRL